MTATIAAVALTSKANLKEAVMMSIRLMTVATLVLALAAAGCTTYYKVTDPGTKKAYYTDDFKRSGSTLQFKDQKSGADVTLPTSEVMEISEDEYKKAIEQK
jgi:hypothetical protein